MFGCQALPQSSLTKKEFSFFRIFYLYSSRLHSSRLRIFLFPRFSNTTTKCHLHLVGKYILAFLTRKWKYFLPSYYFPNNNKYPRQDGQGIEGHMAEAGRTTRDGIRNQMKPSKSFIYFPRLPPVPNSQQSKATQQEPASIDTTPRILKMCVSVHLASTNEKE